MFYRISLPVFESALMMLKMQEAKPLALMVMLEMLAGHAGDVGIDADDVDGLAQNSYISRENAVNYGVLVARMETKQIKSRPVSHS